MPNAYHRRKADRLLRARSNRVSDATVKLIEIDHLQKSYEDAFFTVHGSRTSVTYSHGWYWAHKRRVRQTVLIEMTNLLLAKVHERELLCTE